MTHPGAVTAECGAAPGGDDGDATNAVGSPWVGRRLLVSLLVVVNLPIMVATVRALSRGWQPLGDNGILLVRARDVGTAHNPLLGSWTSASLVLDQNVNNPGPLYFDALAPAVRLLGPWVGLAVGVMLLNMAASSLSVVAARRLYGAPSMVAVAIVVVGLQFAMGSALLFDVWQPNALVLPFLAFLVVVTVLAAGDLAMAPWVVGLGSLLVQTHMSHAASVASMSIAGAGLCALAVRQGRGQGGWRRPLAWSGVVAVLAWCQPVVEELTGRGEGNLSRIVDAATAGGAPTIGWSRAARLTAEIGTMGPWFTRGSYSSAVPPTAPEAPIHGIVGFGPAAAILVAITVALVVGGVRATRGGRTRLATMLAMAGIALATGYVALATSPVNHIAVAIHQMRWLWPVAAFVTAAGLTVLLAAAPTWSPMRGRLLIGGAVAAVVVAVANLPTHTSMAPGPANNADYLEAGQELVGQLGALEGRGTVFYDPTLLQFAEPYSGLTFAEMQDRGVPFVFGDEGFIRQFGEGRRDEGTADLRLWQVEGPDALVVPPGAERVGLADGPSGPVALFVEPIG